MITFESASDAMIWAVISGACFPLSFLLDSGERFTIYRNDLCGTDSDYTPHPMETAK